MKPISNETKTFQVLMSGKWKPAFSGLQLPEGDFQQLTNMRYTETPGIKSVLGMSKISPLTLGFAVTPSISYTTQQMTTTGGGSTQTLTVSGGSTPYGWVIISGGGTLTIVTPGDTTAYLYTAPTTNANCANNPVIQVTEYYGGSKILKIAVSVPGVGGVAYDITACTSTGPGDATFTSVMYDCYGTFYANGAGCSGNSPGWSCASAPPCTGGTSCGVPGRGHDCAPNTYDDRTAQQKTDGCCPVALL